MITVAVYECSGVFCSKRGAPIYNAAFAWLTYQGKTAIPHPVSATQSGNVYTFSIPQDADVRVSAAGHGDTTERMSVFGNYTVCI
jgi:hypothetical protein